MSKTFRLDYRNEFTTTATAASEEEAITQAEQTGHPWFLSEAAYGLHKDMLEVTEEREQ